MSFMSLLTLAVTTSLLSYYLSPSSHHLSYSPSPPLPSPLLSSPPLPSPPLPSPPLPSPLQTGAGLWVARPPGSLPGASVLRLRLHEVVAGLWPAARGGGALQGRKGTHWLCHRCLHELLWDLPEVLALHELSCRVLAVYDRDGLGGSEGRWQA